MNKISLIINNIILSAGTERAVVNLANNLSNNKFEVEIISLNTASGESFYPLNDEVTIKHFNCKSSSSLFLRLIYSSLTIYRLGRYFKNKKQFLIGTVHSVNILLSFIKFFNRQSKYIGCEHMGYDAATTLTKPARRFFYKFLDAVVVLTQADYIRYANTDGIKKCFVIPNQISFQPAEIASCEVPNLLAIGRLTYQKGFDLMLEIVADVLKTHPDWHLTIIGEGEMEVSLKDKIYNLGLTNLVTIEPFTKNVQAKFLDASAYLMTSRFEGLPMVLLEAKACGLPIISFDCPTGPRELISEDDGFLVPMGDNNLFREKIELLIEDAELRKNMGLNALSNIERYKPESVFFRWKSLFDQI